MFSVLFFDSQCIIFLVCVNSNPTCRQFAVQFHFFAEFFERP